MNWAVRLSGSTWFESPNKDRNRFGIVREEAHINVLGAYVQDHTDSLIDYHIVP